MPIRHTSTLLWFLNSSTYKEWLETNGSRVLAVSGHPGCGKTVLSGFLIRRLKNLDTPSLDSHVSYSFCGGGNVMQKTANGILRTLLLQFLTNQPSFALPQIRPFYNKFGKTLFESLDTLWEVFVLVVSAMAGTVFCIIDGLDECEKESRSFIFSKVQELFCSNTLSFRSLKMLFTFRPAYSIEETIFQWTSLLRIKMDESLNELKRDIDLVIEEKVRKYCMFREISDSMQLRIREMLEQKAEGSFLWVDLVLRDLVSGHISCSEESIMKHIHGFPSDLEGVYLTLFKTIDRIEDARRILTWVTLARNPLTLTELRVALKIREEDSSMHDAKKREYSSFKLELLRIVGPFIKVLEEEVHLVHQSAKDFFLGSENQGALQVDQNSWISAPDGHAEIGYTCLK